MSNKELNEGFYQRILRLYEKDSSITVSRMEKHPACEKGESFVSQVSRVKVLGYRDSNKKTEEYQTSLIVKELPPHEQKEMFRSDIAMDNENKTYNTIIPSLQKYSNGSLPMADCIYADKEVIILTDLATEGFQTVGRSSGGLTLYQCEIVLEGLAKIHAASFVSKQTQPREFEKLTKMTKEILFHGGDSTLLDYLGSCIENAIKLFMDLPPNAEHEKALKFLQNLHQSSRSKLRQLLLNPRTHSVMCHGDPWAVNIMFNKKNELKLVDLQLMRYNSVASDLCYLLYVNLPPKVRISNMERLLDHYLNSLRENIRMKNVNLDDVLTRDWLNEEMDTFAVYGLIYGMWIMPVFFVKDEHVEISDAKLSDASKIAEQAGSECEERIKALVLGYVRSIL